MAKPTRPSLDALRRPKPGGAPPAASAAADAGGDALVERGADRRPPGEGARDERAMTLRLSKDLMRSLKLAAINEERPVSEIIRDAIRAYLKSAGGARP